MPWLHHKGGSEQPSFEQDTKYGASRSAAYAVGDGTEAGVEPSDSFDEEQGTPSEIGSSAGYLTQPGSVHPVEGLDATSDVVDVVTSPAPGFDPESFRAQLVALYHAVRDRFNDGSFSKLAVGAVAADLLNAQVAQFSYARDHSHAHNQYVTSDVVASYTGASLRDAGGVTLHVHYALTGRIDVVDPATGNVQSGPLRKWAEAWIVPFDPTKMGSAALMKCASCSAPLDLGVAECSYCHARVPLFVSDVQVQSMDVYA